MHMPGFEVGWFTRCAREGCGRRLPYSAGQTQITCWACGTTQPLVAYPFPWPASQVCGCGKMVQYGPGLLQVTCPWCHNSASCERRQLLSTQPSGLDSDDMQVLGPIAASLGVHSLVSVGMLTYYQGWRVWTEIETTDGEDPYPWGVSIYIESHALPQARMTSEGTWSRIGKSLGIVSEIQIGDQDFDNLVLLQPKESPEGVARMLRSPVARECIKGLLSHDAHEITTGRLVSRGFNVLRIGRAIVGTMESGSPIPDHLGPHVVAVKMPMKMSHPEGWQWTVHTMVTLASELGS